MSVGIQPLSDTFNVCWTVEPSSPILRKDGWHDVEFPNRSHDAIVGLLKLNGDLFFKTVDSGLSPSA